MDMLSVFKKLVGVLFLLTVSTLTFAQQEFKLVENESDEDFANVGPDYLSDEPGSLDEPSEASFQILEKSFFTGDHFLRLHLRSYYRDRQADTTATQAAWAAGGWVDWQSPTLLDGVLKVGFTAYGSQRVIGQNNKDGTGLLKTGQDSFGGVSNIYTALDFGATTGRIGRFEVDMPYMNRSDTRMIPLSFQGAQLLHTLNPYWTFGLSYFTDIKEKNSTDYTPLYKVAGVSGNDYYGVSSLGLRFDDPQDEARNGGFFYHHAPNYLDIYYVDYGQEILSFENSAVSLSGQYTHQEDVGAQLGGSSFDIDQYGGKLDWQSKTFSVVLAYTQYSKSNNQKLFSSWGSVPGYTSVIVSDFNRPGEKAILAGVGVDFARFGLGGLTLSTNYTYGDTPDSGTSASPDQKEWDVTAAYAFPQTFLKGLELRVRNGYLKQSNSNGASDANDVNDFRVILNYVWMY